MSKDRKDNRSPMAKARDEWLASEEGQMCSNPTSIHSMEHPRIYLENRLIRAFQSGANAKQEEIKKLFLKAKSLDQLLKALN